MSAQLGTYRLCRDDLSLLPIELAFARLRHGKGLSCRGRHSVKPVPSSIFLKFPLVSVAAWA